VPNEIHGERRRRTLEYTDLEQLTIKKLKEGKKRKEKVQKKKAGKGQREKASMRGRGGGYDWGS